MAVNQVSLFFYPPHWQQRLTTHPTALTDQGTPLQIAGAMPVESADAEPVSAAAVKEWLAENGFTEVEWGHGRTLQRGQVRSIFGLEKEVEVCMGDEAEEVTE